MKPKLYIHIGMPKTGSSAIQAFLTLNCEKMKKKGYLFPAPPNFDQAYQTSMGNAANLQKLFVNNNLNEISDIIKSYGNEKNVILSSEALYNILIIHPSRFFEVFNQFDYKVICYVRRQDNLVSSLYNQFIKNHNGTSPMFIDEILQKFDFTKVLLDSLGYTEAERLVIRPYEVCQFYGGNIYSDFLNCIGLEVNSDFIYPDNIVNPSLNWDTLEYRRILNGLEVDQDNVLNKHFVNGLLAKYTVKKNMGRPFSENNILSPKERMDIIKSCNERNEQIAKVFLNRKDGKLFYDPLPKTSEYWEPNKRLTYENALDISKYLLGSKSVVSLDDEIIQSLVLGTIQRLLNVNQVTTEKYFHSTIIYRFKDIPINLSRDILIFERKFDFWYIESSGVDPHFTLPSFEGRDNKGNVFVKIGITASSNTLLQLFYLTSNSHFDSKHSISRQIKKGFNEVILEIDDNKPIKSLRLDPGNTEGVYLLHSFEVGIGDSQK